MTLVGGIIGTSTYVLPFEAVRSLEAYLVPQEEQPALQAMELSARLLHVQHMLVHAAQTNDKLAYQEIQTMAFVEERRPPYSTHRRHYLIASYLQRSTSN